MKPIRLLAISIGLLFLIAPAFAQSSFPRQEGSVRVQSTMNFFVAGPTGEGEEALRLRDRARRSVYEMAARECDLLREVLAKDCRMESVNTNIGRQFGQQQQEGFTINATMNFQITLK
jgi:hypothetical protein